MTYLFSLIQISGAIFQTLTETVFGCDVNIFEPGEMDVVSRVSRMSR